MAIKAPTQQLRPTHNSGISCSPVKKKSVRERSVNEIKIFDFLLYLADGNGSKNVNKCGKQADKPLIKESFMINPMLTLEMKQYWCVEEPTAYIKSLIEVCSKKSESAYRTLTPTPMTPLFEGHLCVCVCGCAWGAPVLRDLHATFNMQQHVVCNLTLFFLRQ